MQFKIIFMGLALFCVRVMAGENQTIIEGQAEQKAADFTYFKDKDDDQTPGDASMLFHIPGLTLTESGGHLGKSDIRYHGLSNSLLKVNLQGLNLNSPVTVMTDVNAMFLFAAKSLSATSQSLLIELPSFDSPK